MFLLHGTTLNTACDLMQGKFAYHETAWKMDDGRASDPNAVYFRVTDNAEQFFQELTDYRRGEVPDLAIRGMFYYALTDALEEKYGNRPRDVAVICFELADDVFNLVREPDECSFNLLFGDDPYTCKISNRNLLELYRNNVLIPHSLFVYNKLYLPPFRDEYLLYMELQNQWVPDDILSSDHYCQVKSRHASMGYGQLETLLFSSAINQCYIDNNFEAYKFVEVNGKMAMIPLKSRFICFETVKNPRGYYANSYRIEIDGINSEIQ